MHCHLTHERYMAHTSCCWHLLYLKTPYQFCTIGVYFMFNFKYHVCLIILGEEYKL
jgi:hypothetical protein